MDENLKQDIIGKIIVQEGVKIIRDEAIQIFKSETLENCFSLANEFYKSKHFKVQELGVFLLGYIANENETALQFLKEIVSQNEDWRVQEILAMAFDSFCKTNGYEQSISVIEEWLSFKYANTRRAVTEGLRIWTSRPFFKEYPEKAIALLAPLRNDESEYVRKSVGNALKDISKKHSELVVEELKTWDLSDKSINQVYKLATKYIK
ncbi:DNA alkylation repair protein [Clostridium butyricum]|uniref:DNA alkylation repair protein n=2 Tax=Clostridium butyricum TaxID=1492 RepID=UPI001F55E0BE|nr:DNA alkylation repair protein [Clostridium butyricum]MDI9210499.1 DNA alkylation repair protein [Clostridium butyricum]